MERKEILNDINLFIERENENANLDINLPLVVEDYDIWVNNSDNNEGEDFKVYAIDCDGIYVGDEDFWSFDELSDEEIENIYEGLTD